MAIVGLSIKESSEYRIEKSDILGLRIGGAAIFCASMPLNIFAWKKWKESNDYRKEYNGKNR